MLVLAHFQEQEHKKKKICSHGKTRKLINSPKFCASPDDRTKDEIRFPMMKVDWKKRKKTPKKRFTTASTVSPVKRAYLGEREKVLVIKKVNV